MLRRLSAILVAVLCVLSFAAEAWADRRVALLIGNAAYDSVPTLTNPVNDVESMKAALTGAGFDVVEARTNLSRQDMSQALAEFESTVKGADIGLVFYSGHGIEADGINFLIPTDAKLASDRDVKYEAIDLNDVLQALDGATKLKLVLLDACRDNPFVAKMKRFATKGLLGKGLGQIEATAPNTLIAYAAAPGETALDGDGSTSPFTAALVKHLFTPGLDVDLALRRVRDDVMTSTHQRQVPFKTGSLGGEPIMLGPSSGPAITSSPASPTEVDVTARADYDRAQAVGTTAAWDLFLGYHKTGFYADLARAEREKLSGLSGIKPLVQVAPAPSYVPPLSAEVSPPSMAVTTAEERVHSFTERYIELWNTVTPRDIIDVSNMYADNVLFYNTNITNKKLTQVKLDFVRTWPRRNYKFRDGSMSVQCRANEPEATCQVNAVLDWVAYNVLKRLESTGSARFSLQITMFDVPKIVVETGSVLSQRSQSISSIPE
jgi:hypothetical protein